ncbi:hypothetical protein NP493_282g03014 [Ridgeia piscesae]|uniref:CTHRC1 C-terminal domain-containing protein n=1 Tax=Ridgeia piscesae TaxID=27915 RepID=A0AAD9NX68_RIDPI|nr:hypothetical protein NP493_282g03014 [Ridgeia piscesae]
MTRTITPVLYVLGAELASQTVGHQIDGRPQRHTEDGQSTTAEDSHCSYTFKVPTNDCGQTPMEDQLTKSLLVALQTQVKLLARNQEKLTEENIKQAESFRKLTDENTRLRREMTTFKAGIYENPFISCDFVKKRGDTVLRVVWNGDLRLIDTGPKAGSARRWFFTINGKECSDPSTIDTQLYVRDSGHNRHRPAYVEGYCRGIPAGDVYVAWNVGDVVNGVGWDQSDYNTGDSVTGWVATVRIIVEEVDVENSDTAIV